MRIKTIAFATKESKGLTALRRSMERVGMDYEVIGLGQVWQGFGMKVILTVEYLKTLQDYTHFIFVDGFDTLFLKPITDYEGGILFSCEKHAWPDSDAPYPESSKVWRYLNSGSYIAPIDDYLKLIDGYPVKFEDDDQRYFTNAYLKSGRIRLDTGCRFFQSYAFQTPNDFTLCTDYIINNVTKTYPAVIHFNGKCTDRNIYNMIKYSTLSEAQKEWKDTPEFHKEVHEIFIEKVNAVPELKEHRDFVEQNIFGFGERSFHWFWHLIIKEMPAKFTFLEIGVLKGQVLSLIELLANMQGKKAKRYGITPLSTEGGVWESDYKADIEFIHDKFSLAKDYKILNGVSEDTEIIKQASKLKYDIIYVDGGHSTAHITNDYTNYSHLVKKGGYLVIDDSANHFHMPWGYFQGIQAVSDYVDSVLPPVTANPDFEFLFSVVHNRIWLRK